MKNLLALVLLVATICVVGVGCSDTKKSGTTGTTGATTSSGSKTTP